MAERAHHQGDPISKTDTDHVINISVSAVRGDVSQADSLSCVASHSPLVMLLVHQTGFLQQVLLHICSADRHIHTLETQPYCA